MSGEVRVWRHRLHPERVHTGSLHEYPTGPGPFLKKTWRALPRRVSVPGSFPHGPTSILPPILMLSGSGWKEAGMSWSADHPRGKV